MSKIFNSKIFRIILCALLTVSIFYVPSFLQVCVEKAGITNIYISVLLSLLMYTVLVMLVFFSEIKQEFIIYKNNLKKCLDSGFKYWLLGLVIMIVSNIIINFIIFRGDIAANETLNRDQMLSSPLYYTLLSMAVLGPIIEELIFRKGTEKIFNKKIYYVILSGVLFGFMHVVADLSSLLNLLYLIPYGGLGVAFALMNYETKTVFTSIMMHMVHNFVICMILLAVL